MRDVRELSLFLASPGDVKPEREAVRTVVDELNRSLGTAQRIRIKVIGWDTDSVPDYGADGQTIINRQLGQMEDHDIFVGLMWNRFGTPTPRAGSGTEEEFTRAVHLFEGHGSPRIMMYFSQQPANLSRPEELEQKMRVIRFKELMEQRGLSHSYGSVSEFTADFRQHLSQVLLTWADLKSTTLVPSEVTPQEGRHSPPNQPSPVVRWCLLAGRFYQVKELTEQDGSIVIAIVPENSEEDEMLRQVVHGRQPVQFAYQNIGGVADVRAGERKSVGEDDHWQLSLKLQRTDSMMTEMSYNGRSPRQLAEMRSRFVLLGEDPNSGGDAFVSTFVTMPFHDRASTPTRVFSSLFQQGITPLERLYAYCRLAAVFYLKSSGTIDQVVRLAIGPIEAGGLKVDFEGIRPKFYSNVEPERIIVKGLCPLD